MTESSKNLSDSENDFDLTKTTSKKTLPSKPELRKSVTRKQTKKANFKRLKIDSLVPLPAYAVAALPEYEFIEEFFGEVNLDRVVSETISADQIVDNMVRKNYVIICNNVAWY